MAAAGSCRDPPRRQKPGTASSHDDNPSWKAHKITGATAALFGLGDRGVLTPGKKGDVNLIDFDRLQLHRPESVSDLPGGASRLIQRSDGYLATINAGLVTMERGSDTGARPGVLLRGAR